MLLKSTVQLGLGWVFAVFLLPGFFGGFTRKKTPAGKPTDGCGVGHCDMTAVVFYLLHCSLLLTLDNRPSISSVSSRHGAKQRGSFCLLLHCMLIPHVHTGSTTSLQVNLLPPFIAELWCILLIQTRNFPVLYNAI